MNVRRPTTSLPDMSPFARAMTPAHADMGSSGIEVDGVGPTLAVGISATEGAAGCLARKEKRRTRRSPQTPVVFPSRISLMVQKNRLLEHPVAAAAVVFP